MKILLPAIFDNISLRKDRSIKLSFVTREFSAEEITFLMGMRDCEGWLLYSPNELSDKDMQDIPSEDALIEPKTPSQRMKAVLFVLYQQATEKGTFKGEFQSFYKAKMEAIITQLKDKIED